MNRAMKSIVALLFGLLLCFPAMSEAQSNRLVYGEQIHAGSNGTMTVSYGLADVHALYEVRLLLSTDGGNTYHPIPEAVSGDVGRSIKPGLHRRIAWDYETDFPVDFGTGAYDLRVEAKRQNRGGDSWLVYAGIGAGMLAAGITAGVLLNNGSDSGGISIPLGRGR